MSEPRVTLHLLRTETVMHRGRRSYGEAKPVNLDRYEVRLDGTRVGTVERAMVTREAPRARGSRVSNGRWQSPAWIADGRHYRDRPSRAKALELLLNGPLTGLVDDGTGRQEWLWRVEAQRAVVVKP